MRTAVGCLIAVALAGGLYAQSRGFANLRPVVTGGFGNVVHPGGTAATMPGIQRGFGNVVYPGGGGPRLLVPNPNYPARQRRQPPAAFVWAYPTYVGGYGYGFGYEAPPEPQQPNVTVIYPPEAAPVIVNQFGSGESRALPPDAATEPPAPTAEADAPHYLIAFKDHTIYSAIAYWVDGATLHYFTAGNTHNQASLALVDRDLTARLNRESGIEVKLPAEKQ